LIKGYPRMLQTKFDDHPAISFVEEDFKGLPIFIS
jgi:hypothetical protein